jgi:hypothetical protein
MTKSFINTTQWLLCLLLVLQALRGHSLGGAVNDSAQKPTGMYIHGSMGIPEGSGIAVFGDLYLDSANLIGAGTLAMQGNKPQNVVALHSQISNLRIDNPSNVCLQGDLRITNSLAVMQGVFDTQHGTLLLTDTTQLIIYPEAQLLSAKEHLNTALATINIQDHQGQPLAMIAPPATLNTPQKSPQKAWINKPFFDHPNHLQRVDQPPDCPLWVLA